MRLLMTFSSESFCSNMPVISRRSFLQIHNDSLHSYQFL